MNQLKIELKQWENLFIAKNGRDPSISDIDKLPDIKYKYKKYSKLKRKLKKQNISTNSINLNDNTNYYSDNKNNKHVNTTNRNFEKTPEKFQESYLKHKGFETDQQGNHKSNGNTSGNKTNSTQTTFDVLDNIGPTPQIIGKSISILDLSPIKKNLNLELFSDNENDDQITATEAFDVGANSVKENFGEISQVSLESKNLLENENIYKSNQVTSESKKNTKNLNDKTLHKTITVTTYGPNSPLKLPTLVINNEKIIFNIHNTPQKIDNITPRKHTYIPINNASISNSTSKNTNLNTTNLTNSLINNLSVVNKSFISPSPIWKKSLNKSLTELENEYKSVRKELKLTDENVDLNAEGDNDSNENTIDNDSKPNENDLECDSLLTDTDDDTVDGDTRRELTINDDMTLVENTLEDSLNEKEYNSNDGNDGKFKPKTIKTKRRHVIKRLDGKENDSFDINQNINLHAMLRSIKKRKISEFFHDAKIIDNESSFEDEKLNEDDKSDKNNTQPPKKSKRNKKYNLVSNNFRRLKLPRRNKARNSNWKRR